MSEAAGETDVVVLEKPIPDDGRDSLAHYYCQWCDPEGHKAFCGKDLSNAVDVEGHVPLSEKCVVCVQLKPSHRCWKGKK